MKSLVIKLTVLTVFLSVTGCVNYNPNHYNKVNKRFYDYEKNYSIKILDGYELFADQSQYVIPVVGRYYIDAYSTVFYNRRKGLYFYINWVAKVPHALDSDTKRWKHYMADSLKRNHLGAETTIYKDAVIGDIGIEQGTRKSKYFVIGKPYQSSKESSHFSIIKLALTPESFKAKVDKNDLIKMFDSLELTVFDEDERYVKEDSN